MPRVGFWDKIEPDSGRTYLDLARELRAGGASCAAIEKQLDGPVNSLAAKLNDGPPAAKPKKPAPQQAQAAVVSASVDTTPAERPEAPQKPLQRPVLVSDDEPEESLLEAASADELRGFIRYLKRERAAEQYLAIRRHVLREAE